jgi:hypothetical protein
MPQQPMSPSVVAGWVIAVVIVIAAMWKVFIKAGRPGWAAIVPIYNLIVLLQVAGKPVWWVLLLLIPLVNIVSIHPDIRGGSAELREGGWLHARPDLPGLHLLPDPGVGERRVSPTGLTPHGSRRYACPRPAVGCDAPMPARRAERRGNMAAERR